MSNKEVWKGITGYEGIYQISNMGRVKSLERVDAGGHKRYEIIMESSDDRVGYQMINLSKDGKTKTFKVHRLVTLAFIENKNNLPQVNHKDEIKHNNEVSNLEWCSHSYNINYGTCIDRGARKQSKEVYQYDLNNKFINKFKSGMDVERKLGFDQAYVNHCCNGKYKKAYGYIWSYEGLKK